ncbi:MAG: PD40 domain-containing protein, partial [Cyclobacteriaceae bacterium]|nr:PD40 domain-containing protein [Cyclobacteriaceae bacterium]
MFILLIAFTAFIENTDGPQTSVVSEFEEVVFATRRLGEDGHWYANLGYYAFDENKKLYTSGSTLCKLNIRTGDLKILFHDDAGTFRDPQLHYDGKRIIFSYRKGNTEHFHLYETDTEGSYLKQLTSGPFSDIEPTYLPDGDIIFVSTRCECWVNCWSSQVATLHRCKADGSEITKLSANIEHDNT